MKTVKNVRDSILNERLPTPKTLDEAIEHALCIGPLCEIKERSYTVLKDFLAQKFGIAYMKADPATLAVLEQLFEALTVRPNQPAENSTLKVVDGPDKNVQPNKLAGENYGEEKVSKEK